MMRMIMTGALTQDKLTELLSLFALSFFLEKLEVIPVVQVQFVLPTAIGTLFGVTQV